MIKLWDLMQRKFENVQRRHNDKTTQHMRHYEKIEWKFFMHATGRTGLAPLRVQIMAGRTSA